MISTDTRSLLLLTAVLFCGSNCVAAQRYLGCTTPDREAGYCVLLANCPELSVKLTVGDYRRFVNQSRCGYGEDQLPRVCCTHPAPGNLNYFPDVLPTVGICGVESSIVDRITGGDDADLFEHPWTVLIINEKVRGRNALFCGGALINSRWILTAAHCVYEERPKELDRLSVRLGENTISTPTDCKANTTTCIENIDVRVEQLVVHENYHPQSLHYDIALIKLARPVHYNHFIKPICLPQTRDLQYEEADDIIFEVTGWGKTAPNATLSDTKKIIRLKGFNVTECNKQFSSLKPSRSVNNLQFCAGGAAGEDTCRGDSGSPMVGYAHDAQGLGFYYLAGIASFGLNKCGTEGWPGVYTKVWKFMDWIITTIRRNSKQQEPATTTQKAPKSARTFFFRK